MKLFAAIDLMEGKVVRLRRGEETERTVYSENPVEYALRWESAGADWLHVVDLDAAFSGGRRNNLMQVRAICEAVKIPCELGGGMRNMERVREAISAGVSRVVVGTRAYESQEFLGVVCEEFGGERLAVGIDCRDGFVAIEGWRETTKVSAAELAMVADSAGASAVIVTDVATDGMMEGPNFSLFHEIRKFISCDLIASGGVGSVEDLRRLAGMGGIDGVIVGKALYEGKIPLPFSRLGI